jgi:hypothetical protein
VRRGRRPRPLTLSIVPTPLLLSQSAHAKGKLNSKSAWLADDEGGIVLKEYCYGKVKASTAVLFALQSVLFGLGFPQGDKGVPLIFKAFEALYDRDIMAEDAMHAWRDDIRNLAPGHDKALIQTEP